MIIQSDWLNVVGFTTDGEWNLLRTKAYSRVKTPFYTSYPCRCQVQAQQYKSEENYGNDYTSMYVSFNLKQFNMHNHVSYVFYLNLDQNGTLITMSPNNAASLELLVIIGIQRVATK